jgi:Mg/Co/Ni transporter MgtE
MMNPDFVSAPASATVREALARIRASELGPQQVSIVCITDEKGELVGTVSLADLVRDELDQVIGDQIEESTPAVPTEADLPEVARLMTDFNLIAMPVIDAQSRPVGIVAVDDVLELLLPEEWRRRAGAARD